MSQQKQYDNTNRFALFKREEEKTDDRDADYSGTLNVDGREFYIDGWVKTSQNGLKMLTGKIKPKQGTARPAPRNQGPDDL